MSLPNGSGAGDSNGCAPIQLIARATFLLLSLFFFPLSFSLSLSHSIVQVFSSSVRLNRLCCCCFHCHRFLVIIVANWLIHNRVTAAKTEIEITAPQVTARIESNPREANDPSRRQLGVGEAEVGRRQFACVGGPTFGSGTMAPRLAPQAYDAIA